MTTHLSYIRAAVVIVLLCSGCAVFDPVAEFTGQRYTNAISYFNTFYNAQRLFNEAEDEVLQARRGAVEKPAGHQPSAIPASARQKFQTSIEKNSKVLSFYPESKWVDDALMMIGKSYFYMGDDLRSERKFLELIAQFPGSDELSEAQLWLGKCLLRQKRKEEGIKLLEAVYAQTSASDEEIAGAAAYELGEYYYSAEEFANAEKKYSLAADLIDDDELLARIHFQRGLCHLALEQYDKAESAFSEARDNSPLYTMTFKSAIQQLKAAAARQRYDEALDGLRTMLDDTKNSEFFGIIHFEIANVLMLKGAVSEAVEKYRYVDTAFARSDEAARSYFVLGNYYEDREQRYDSALTMYAKARSEFPSSEITPRAAAKFDIFSKYFSLQKELHRYDSLYNDEREKKRRADSSFAAEEERLRKDSVRIRIEQRIKVGSRDKKSDPVRDSIAAVDSVRSVERLNIERAHASMRDSLIRSQIRTKFELAGLFFLEIGRRDSAMYWFNEVIASDSTEQFAPRALYTIAEIVRSDSNSSPTELNAIYHRIIKTYPESPYANESRRILGLPMRETAKDSAQELFERSELLSEQLEFVKAVQLYKSVADRFPVSPFAAKALYAAGWHFEHRLNNADSAVAEYRRLVARYPVSPLAQAVRPKLLEFDNEMKKREQERQKEIEEKKSAENKPKDAPANLSPATPSDSASTTKKIP